MSGVAASREIPLAALKESGDCTVDDRVGPIVGRMTDGAPVPTRMWPLPAYAWVPGGLCANRRAGSCVKSGATLLIGLAGAQFEASGRAVRRLAGAQFEASGRAVRRLAGAQFEASGRAVRRLAGAQFDRPARLGRDAHASIGSARQLDAAARRIAVDEHEPARREDLNRGRAARHASTRGELTTIVPNRSSPDPANRRCERSRAGGATLRAGAGEVLEDVAGTRAAEVLVPRTGALRADGVFASVPPPAPVFPDATDEGALRSTVLSGCDRRARAFSATGQENRRQQSHEREPGGSGNAWGWKRAHPCRRAY